MESKQKLDITTLPGYENVRNLVYKIVQEQLNQQSLSEQMGYDLANCTANMDHYLLPGKHKVHFDEYVGRLLAGANSLTVLTSTVLGSEEEIFVFRQKYRELKAEFDRETSKPALTPDVDIIQVTEEGHQSYGKQYTVASLYYEISLLEWIVKVKGIDNPKNKHQFRASQIGKI